MPGGGWCDGCFGKRRKGIEPDDREAVAILKKCRDAMRPGGKVLVVETVIPSGNEPCFGKWLDLMMLVVGGRERTKEQYAELFSMAGLRLARIVPTAHEVSVIEGVRREQERQSDTFTRTEP
jgi:hypothetical protein